jgi:hypothetical protein
VKGKKHGTHATESSAAAESASHLHLLHLVLKAWHLVLHHAGEQLVLQPR